MALYPSLLPESVMQPPPTNNGALGGTVGGENNGSVLGGAVVGGITNNNDINALIANALQNPAMRSSAQVLLQTMDFMNARSMPTPTPPVAATAASAASVVNNNNGMQQVAASPFPAVINGSQMIVIAPTNGSCVPTNNGSVIMSQHQPLIPGFNNSSQQPQQQQQPISGVNSIMAVPNFNTMNIMPNTTMPMMMATTPVVVTATPQQQPQQQPLQSTANNALNNFNLISDSKHQGNYPIDTSCSYQDTSVPTNIRGTNSNNNNGSSGNNDFEPSNFRTTVQQQATATTELPNTVNVNGASATEDEEQQECLNLLLDNSFLNDLNTNIDGIAGNGASISAAPSLVPAVSNTFRQEQQQQLVTTSMQQPNQHPTSSPSMQSIQQQHLSQHQQLSPSQQQQHQPNQSQPSQQQLQMQGSFGQASQQQMNLQATLAVALSPALLPQMPLSANFGNQIQQQQQQPPLSQQQPRQQQQIPCQQQLQQQTASQIQPSQQHPSPSLQPRQIQQQQPSQQQQQSSSSPQQQQQSSQSQPTQQQLQMQERLRQVSQEQMQQFSLLQQRQKQLRQQQLLKMQQRQQQQMQQSSTMSMMSDLQALQALHGNQDGNKSQTGNAINAASSINPVGSATLSGQGQVNVASNISQVVTPTDDTGLASNATIQAACSIRVPAINNNISLHNQIVKNHPPLEPNKERPEVNIISNIQRKRTARSTSRASHNPRADNSSNWDNALKPPQHSMSLQQKQQQAVSNIHQTIRNRQHAQTKNFHYIKVVGGGVKRPASSSPQATHVNKRVNLTAAHDSVAGNAGATRQAVVPSPNHQPKQQAPASTSSLQNYCDDLLTSRGYAPKKLPASKLGYRQPPTPLQLASFGFAVCSTIKPNGADRLTALLRSGLSPNPTNKFGDSPFFMACKRGLFPLVKVFLDEGADVRVADGFGRTPLHYVTWSNPPCLKSARLLLEADARLLYVTDAHGKTPLDFVASGEAPRSTWIKFLEGVKDEFWPPVRDGGDGGKEYFPQARDQGPSEVSGMPDPKDALSVELAEKVASGHIMPEEAKRQQQQQAVLG